MAKAKRNKGNKAVNTVSITPAIKAKLANALQTLASAPAAVTQPQVNATSITPTVVTTVASVATKLTKRNTTPLNAVLVATNKVNRNRAPHVQAAWQAVVAALPATATQLATLPALAHPQCVSPQAFLSYMLRRGHLAIQGQ